MKYEVLHVESLTATSISFNIQRTLKNQILNPIFTPRFVLDCFCATSAKFCKTLFEEILILDIVVVVCSGLMSLSTIFQ